MKIWKTIVGIILFLQFGMAQAAWADESDQSDVPDKDAGFEYYLGEFSHFEQDRSDPMARLIIDGLTNTLFDCNDETTFRTRIQQIQSAYKENPDKAERFMALDKRLKVAFDARIQAAKSKRMMYTAIGAVVGMAIAIPVGYLMGSKLIPIGNKILWLVVPTGALMGAGAGFLLADLLAMPHYKYEPGELNKDLQSVLDQLATN